MPNKTSRPAMLPLKCTESRFRMKRGLHILAPLLISSATLPALAQNETAVPFTDIPDNINFTVDPNSPTRFLDIRTIDGPFTPKDRFFALQHFGQPTVDPATYRLKVTGLVNKPIELSLDEIRKRPSIQIGAGFECSGNGPRRIQGLVSNGNWTGIRLRDLLTSVGVKPEGIDAS